MNGDIKVIIDGNTIKSPDYLLSKRLSYAEIAILLALIEAKGEIVNRDDLISKGWPGKIVVPNSLNMAILALRRALGPFGLSDNIVTVPRGGFRLEQYYVFLNSDKTEVYDSGDIVERDSPSIIIESEVEHSSSSNKKHHQFTSADFSCELVQGNNKKIILSDVALGVLLLFNMFVFIHLSSNRPAPVCDVLKDKITICALELNEDVMNAADEYISRSELKKQGVLWVELNPHQKDGYKFYFLE